jgi:acyl dehydratase
MSTRPPRYAAIEDVLGSLGDELGPSRWLSLDQNRIDTFARVTEDRQWIHTDPSRAAEGPYGQTVAHGFLTLSLVAPVVTDIFTVGGLNSAVNYGLDRVRFPGPALSGRRLRGVAIVQQLEPTTAGLRVTLRATLECEGGNRPVCVADLLMLLIPRRALSTPPCVSEPAPTQRPGRIFDGTS